MEHVQVCLTHGKTAFVVEGRGYLRCKKCRYQNVQNRRKRVKQTLVEFKGSKCERCGYSRYPEVMEFHHPDPTKKDFTIAYRMNWAIERLKIEVAKCQMLCANCHREVHVELRRNQLE